MMSECFTLFLISGLGEPNIYQNLVWITRMWGIYDIVVIFDFDVFLGVYCFRGGYCFILVFHSPSFHGCFRIGRKMVRLGIM